MDEAALECDFAETYHIYDYRALPARKAALYACGLRAGSRIMRKLSGAPADLRDVLLAVIADATRTLIWQNTKDGVEGRNQPASFLRIMIGEKENESHGFDSVEEFTAWRSNMLGGGGNA